MTARNRRSRDAEAGAGSRPQDDGSSEVRGIGWGLSAEEEEDFLLRRVLFSVLVVVMVCIGIWFLLTTVRSAPEQPPALSARGAVPPGQGDYTIRLMDFPASKQEEAMRLTQVQAIRDVAEQQEFCCLPLDDGRMALCVGSFPSESSPEMQELLAELRSFAAQGKKLFEGATVYLVP